MKKPTFRDTAEQILNLEIEHRVNELGGYGSGGEVIYEAHPSGCPSVLVDKKGSATATFMSNGSVGLTVKLENGMDVHVLDTSFETVEKRETGAPSSNVWLDVSGGKEKRTASLMNPRAAVGLEASAIRVVKVGDPERAMWYCAWFDAGKKRRMAAAVRLALVLTPQGPTLTRDIYVRNDGKKTVDGKLWTYFNTHGTQRFVYNKECWYDMGLPVSNRESVISATVPYSEIIQLKRISSETEKAKAEDATCDYATFVGDTSEYAIMPAAVREGRMLKG
ncbi:MAG TPA: hypothetical protein ENN09_03145, partial [Planctomycetes bacterium]|nr:hypothetical protein [Planctomycetota bacterium]